MSSDRYFGLPAHLKFFCKACPDFKVFNIDCSSSSNHRVATQKFGWKPSIIVDMQPAAAPICGRHASSFFLITVMQSVLQCVAACLCLAVGTIGDPRLTRIYLNRPQS
jgi:hypothetical protein